ncbi:DNA ligase [Liberibacter crescens BT-1]|uniref:DNA ligase n=1 Tax=Liberibacter crescens (strain BT-1) TaxID=1215343 RepID=L0EVB9_LIBCB|nr:NAD-dependent DNA ligase LigA [Liberibacter crescens]AGA64593.1 DNA ligase [Liberibacter crescens BT-1]AMC13348.1 NAD-dependent DNA ligase LigA [Liberibacter crescens]
MEVYPVQNLTEEQAKQELSFLSTAIAHHDKLYYNDSAPEISDAEYDTLKQRYFALESYFPHLVFYDSPSYRVGFTPSSTFASVVHSQPMLSLDNSFSDRNIEDFISGIYRSLGRPVDNSIAFTVEPKIDGLSIAIRYEKGQLVTAATRGDGLVGENVTKNVLTIEQIPKILPKQAPDILEVRGEIYMARSDFLLLNEQMISEGKNTYASPRNTASGSLRQLDAQITASRRLQFFAYGLGEVSTDFVDSQYEALQKLRSWNFPINQWLKKFYNLKDILAYYHEIDLSRPRLDYDIDGVVYKVDDFVLQKKLGSRSRSPRWATAHKFLAEQAYTRLLNIEIQVGRTGALTPVARLEPITIGGVVVANATLHNEDYIKGLGASGELLREGRDIRIGDIVVVNRAGDVIPQVIDVVLDQRSPDIQPFRFPSFCPVCKSHAVRDIDSKTGKIDSVRRCTGSFICPAQGLERLKHVVSRNAFNIKGLGDKQIEFFFHSEDPSLYIKNAPDIFTLQHRQQESITKLENISGFGKVSVNKLYDAINERRSISLDRFIFSLGIRHVGIETARCLAETYGSYKNFESSIKQVLYKEENACNMLKSVPLVGDVIVHSIIEFYKEPGNLNVIDLLLQEVSLKDNNQDIFKKKSALSGKTIVFTGSLETMNREDAKIKAIQLGAKVSSSVSQLTDIIVVGKNPGSKVLQGNSLGISLINEQQWIDFIKKSF